MYEYRVIQVLRVVDGDTIDAQISLGFGLSATFRFRLTGIDAKEIYGANSSEEGRQAAEFVKRWLDNHFADGNKIIVQTQKTSDATVGIGDGAFGRWSASFFAVDSEGKEYDMGLEFLQAGRDKGWFKE